MSNRLRALRLVIVAGYSAVGLGVAFWLFGAPVLIFVPGVSIAFLPPAFSWATGMGERTRMIASIRAAGAAALTSDQMDWALRASRAVTLDDDPDWGKLVEGRDAAHGQTLTAVQVTNSTPEPDGTYKQVWLRVPSRGDRQGARICTHAKCGKDISWPPRTAREAIAWTFRVCVDHYKPAKAS